MKSRLLLRTLGPLLGLLATWILFAVLAGTKFTSWSNHELMLLQTAVVGTAAVGTTWIIIAGGIDLAVGSTIALGCMVGAMVLRAGGGPALSVLATIATGTAVGWLIGALVVGGLVRVAASLALAGLAGALGARLGLPWFGFSVPAAIGGWFLTRRVPPSLPLSPFIVTLGLWGALRGLGKGLGQNQPIYYESGGGLAALMLPGSFLPPGVWILIGVAGLAVVLLRHTVFGRHVTALGQNRETTRLSGIDVVRTELRVYVLGCTCVGVAAVLQLSYLSMGDPTTAQGYELKAIASAVIGGASLAGGVGSIGGTLIGAFLMTVVDNGCTKLGFDNWVQEVVTGGIILAAVALDRWRRSA